jgi:hypothetical protein
LKRQESRVVQGGASAVGAALQLLQAGGVLEAAEAQEALLAVRERPAALQRGCSDAAAANPVGAVGDLQAQMEDAALQVDIFSIALAMMQILQDGSIADGQGKPAALQGQWQAAVAAAGAVGATERALPPWDEEGEEDGGERTGHNAGEADALPRLVAIAWLLHARQGLAAAAAAGAGPLDGVGAAPCAFAAALLAADGVHAPQQVQNGVLAALASCQASAAELRRVELQMALLPGGALPRPAATMCRLLQQAAAGELGQGEGVHESTQDEPLDGGGAPPPHEQLRRSFLRRLEGVFAERAAASKGLGPIVEAALAAMGIGCDYVGHLRCEAHFGSDGAQQVMSKGCWLRSSQGGCSKPQFVSKQLVHRLM